MIRRSIIIVSAILAIGALAFYALSYKRLIYGDFLISSRNRVEFYASKGRVSIYVLGPKYTEARLHLPDRLLADDPDVGWRIEEQNIGCRVGRELVRLSCCCWMPLILFASYPTIVFIRGPFRRYRRRKRGCCESCGYNLMGNTSGVCSECGRELVM